MKALPSTIEREQFVQALKLCQEVGWYDSKIADTLKVSHHVFQEMIHGLLPPSQKHIGRPHSLMQHSPPRRPPPAPSSPIVKPPAFANGNGSSSGHATATLEAVPMKNEPTPIETPSAVEPKVEAAPKEIPMETATSTNGLGHNEPPVSRHHTISLAAAKDLRRAMLGALVTKYSNSVPAMASALEVSSNGLRRMLFNKKASMSTLTQESFSKLTGWSLPDKTRTRPEPKEKPEAPRARATRARRSNLLPDTLLLPFRAALKKEIEARTVTVLAEEMGATRSALQLIAEGKRVATKGMLEKWERFQARTGQTPTLSKHETIVHPPEAVPAAGFNEPLAVEKRKGRALVHGLHRITASLLLDGLTEEARLMAIIARVSEVTPMAVITQTLGALLTSTGRAG